MYIRDSQWQDIRQQFSEEEKAQLREALVGETLCPRGFHINEDGMLTGLLAKLRALIPPLI